MTILGLDHVQLAMPQGGEAQAIDFYQDGLGITQVPKPEVLATRGGCWFESGVTRLHLGVEADFRPARKAHPALVVSDLDALLSRLTARGHTTTTGEVVDGRRRAFVDDPFGNRIELMEPRPPTA